MADPDHTLPSGSSSVDPFTLPSPTKNNPFPAAPHSSPTLSGMPSKQRQSWGAVISIVIIVAMVVTGAFYAWGKRISEQNELYAPAITE